MWKKLVKFFCNKLGRDKDLAIDKAAGIQATHRYLDKQELQNALKNKLIEEATEVTTAISKEEIISELADVLEVIDGLCKAHGIEKSELLAQKEKQYQKRGGFETGYYVEYIEMAEDNLEISYFRAPENADRYPEEQEIEQGL